MGSPARELAELDDLLSDEAINDPFAFYARLRTVDPVYWNRRWGGWIVTGYKPVVAGFRDHHRLASDRFAGPFGAELSKSGSEYELLFAFLSKFFVWKDPPYHTHVRTLLNKAFTPKSVEVLRPRVRELVRELGEPLRGRADVDFLAEFAFNLPVIVIAEFLGIPPEARQDVREWSNDLGEVIFVQGESSDRMERGQQAMSNLVDFLRPIVRARRQEPREDFLTAMMQAEERGDLLSEDEVIANAVLMVFAGHETTMNLLANGVVAFNKFPDEWERLRRDPELVRSGTEEILRYDGPIRAMARWAKQSFELGSHRIEEGDRVLLVQHAANHDPMAYTDPERLDVGRWPNKHTAFGQGIHTCLGAPLARLEAQEALRYLTTEFEMPAVLEDRLTYNPTIVSRSLKRLHVSLRGR